MAVGGSGAPPRGPSLSVPFCAFKAWSGVSWRAVRRGSDFWQPPWRGQPWVGWEAGPERPSCFSGEHRHTQGPSSAWEGGCSLGLQGLRGFLRAEWGGPTAPLPPSLHVFPHPVSTRLPEGKAGPLEPGLGGGLMAGAPLKRTLRERGGGMFGSSGSSWQVLLGLSLCRCSLQLTQAGSCWRLALAHV